MKILHSLFLLKLQGFIPNFPRHQKHVLRNTFGVQTDFFFFLLQNETLHYKQSKKHIYICISAVQSLSCVQLCNTRTAASQASLSITNSRSLLKLVSIELMIPLKYLILCYHFFSCLQSFPASGSFPMSQFFASSRQNIGVSASASVLPKNIQD